MNLSGHTVLITGAGTGMGLEAAKERDGSPIKVVEFMAPPVDSPFSAAVASGLKMSPAAAVDGESSDAALRAVNAATGG